MATYHINGGKRPGGSDDMPPEVEKQARDMGLFADDHRGQDPRRVQDLRAQANADAKDERKQAPFVKAKR